MELWTKKDSAGPEWWFRPLILALGRQRQVNFWKFDASLSYIASRG